MTYLIAYISTLIAFFALDMLWLGLIARKFYANQLGSLMADSPNWLVAIVFYAMYIVGIVFFAIRPAIEAEQVLKATLYGALFGFFCYATYDLTNLATLRDWPTKMVFVDILWGIILTGSCATVGAWATLKFAA
ncbi:DUF2177 family protein [Litorimonas sp.]|jgi:uncharacterized membrane protein|uniref:DUF2177 family protein n=1 Tax=Litorimonas sp. TaxID=1892381 RepID=UPI003A84BF9B